MIKNYALPGNPNDHFTRLQAIQWLADACINDEECEWAACSVRLVGMGLKSKEDALRDITKVGEISCILTDEQIVAEVYTIIQENLL